MKRLVLVRHGKSSWKHDLPDDQRPLKKRGYSDAELVTNFYEDFYTSPALFWVSPAVRASETAKIFKKHFMLPDDYFEVKDELYTFEGSELLKVIKSCDDAVNRLFVFGHNPGLTNVANRVGDQYFENIPTTGLVVIDFETDHWDAIKNGKTVLNVFPKNLK
ncbi:MAG TPA: histidine phosphatase family protein [Salinimicrobium sp.]|nr:histidine phosphatase family protein [Salinimicrobium sp.]